MITQEYNLNLIPDKVPVSVDCSQYDSLSRTIVFNIYDGTVLKDVSEATATVRGTKQDNTGFEYSCTVNGSTVSFDIQDQMTIFSGKVPCEIRLINNGILGTCNFILNVEPTPLDPNVTISETDLPLLEEAEQNAIRAEQAADEAESLLSTVVKSVNNTFPDASGNVTVQTSSPLSAGTGISIANDVVSNTAPIWHGNEVGDLPVPINMAKVTTLFEDSAKTEALYPRTKVSAISDANNTSLTELLENVDAKCLVITSASFSSLPQTITNANITSDMVIINSVLSNPSAQTGDWTVTTSNGSLSISGSISGATTITLYLMRGE